MEVEGMFKEVTPVKSLSDKWSKMSVDQLKDEYVKYAQLNADQYYLDKMNEVMSKNTWLKILKEEYMKSPESKLRTSILGDWSCHGDCENCRHKHTELANEFGKWIDSLWDWQIFFTGTFDTKKITKNKPTWTMIGQEFTSKAFDKFIEYLNEYNYPGNNDKVTFVAGLEKQSRGDYHIHALLGNLAITNVYGIEQWKLWWDNNYGWSSWYIYQKNRGANYYLCKYLIKDGNISIGINETEVYNIQPDLVSAIDK